MSRAPQARCQGPLRDPRSANKEGAFFRARVLREGGLGICLQFQAAGRPRHANRLEVCKTKRANDKTANKQKHKRQSKPKKQTNKDRWSNRGRVPRSVCFFFKLEVSRLLWAVTRPAIFCSTGDWRRAFGGTVVAIRRRGSVDLGLKSV